MVLSDCYGRERNVADVAEEFVFAACGDPSERVPGRRRIDAGGRIPQAASVKLIAE